MRKETSSFIPSFPPSSAPGTLSTRMDDWKKKRRWGVEEFRRDWPFFEFILLYNLDFQKFVDVLHIENINQKNGGG